jgi:serine/threonine protein kinase
MLKKNEIVKMKQVDHILSEKQIMRQIAHPFIVNLYHNFQDDKLLYMLLEYVAGGELFSHLRKCKRFSDEVSRFYAAEIVSAFEYLHKKDIAYRDLKPENLLIDCSGHLKITDFGFAKQIPDRTYTLCGTPEYLAPESIVMKGHGKQVDWWALGILIYEMLSGYPPFYDDNPMQIYKQILACEISWPSIIGVYARDLISKLVEKDITIRYGCLFNGVKDVQNHIWFSSIDWSTITEKKLKPPFVPLAFSPGDTSNFDKYSDDVEVIAVQTKEAEIAFANF